MTVSERMFSIMEARGLKAANLCRILGIGTNITTGWKQRGTDPPAKYLVQICEFLGCSLEYLLTGQETEKAPVPEISRNGQEMLKYFEALDEGDQRQVIGVAQGMVLSAAQKDRPSYGPASGSGAKVV